MAKSETSIMVSSIPSYDQIIENLAKTLYESSRRRNISTDEEKFPDWNSLLNGGSTADYILANYRLLAVESLEFFIEMFKKLGIDSDNLQRITTSLESDTEKLDKLTSDTEKLDKLTSDTEKLDKLTSDTEKLDKLTSDTDLMLDENLDKKDQEDKDNSYDSELTTKFTAPKAKSIKN